MLKETTMPVLPEKEKIEPPVVVDLVDMEKVTPVNNAIGKEYGSIPEFASNFSLFFDHFSKPESWEEYDAEKEIYLDHLIEQNYTYLAKEETQDKLKKILKSGDYYVIGRILNVLKMALNEINKSSEGDFSAARINKGYEKEEVVIKDINSGQAKQMAFQKTFGTLDALLEDDPPYFLKLRLEDALMAKSMNYHCRLGRNKVPVVLSGGRYVFNAGNELLLSMEKDTEKISEWLVAYNESKSRLDSYYKSVGHFNAENYTDHAYVDPLFKKKGENEKLLEDYFATAINLGDFIREHAWGKYSSAELGKEYASDYLFMIEKNNINKLNELLGVNLEELKILEQIYFLNYIKNAKCSEIDDVVVFSKKQGVNGLRAFLSCELNIENGRKILSIGEKLKPEEAQKVFAKIAELADLAERENEELTKIFYNNGKETDMSGAKFELLKKVQKIIVGFSDKLNNRTNSEAEIEKLLDDLENCKAETIFFKSLFKTVIKEHPEMMFEDFRDLEVQFNRKDLPEEDKEKMRSMLEKNYANLEERKIALAGLEKGLKNEDSDFSILRHKGEVISFLRFDRQPDEDCLYFGSFNTNPDYQGAFFGEEFMKECLESEFMFGAEKIEAHTFPDKRITSKYIEEAGFIVEDIKLNYLGTSKALFKIKRDDRVNWRYKFRAEAASEDRKFFETMAGSGDVPEKGNPFLKIEASKISDPATLEKIKAFMQKHKLVITRYFPDNKENPKYFVLAFEAKIPEPESAAYIV